MPTARRAYEVARHKAGLMKRAVLTGVKDWRDPEWVPNGHYYSPLPSTGDVDRVLSTTPRTEIIDVDLNAEAQLALFEQLAIEPPTVNRWDPDNTMFGATDAAILQAVLRHLRPGRILEIGSGYSTAVMLDVAESTLPDLQVVCVEPYADRLRSRLRPADHERMRLIESPVEVIPVDELVSLVGPGDLLFIDSTHVVKVGSDVCYLFFEVLPRLPVGAVVQIHDMFWPFEYPQSWIKERRGWAELYLLRAFLTNNDAWEILFFSSWFWAEHPDKIPPGVSRSGPGSLYLRRKA